MVRAAARRFCFAACFTLLWSAAEVRARTVVLRSSGPSASRLPAGTLLQEPVFIRLERGDRLSVLDARGTRQFRGPRIIDDRKRRPSTADRLPSWEALTGDAPRPVAAVIRGFGNYRKRKQAGTHKARSTLACEPLCGRSLVCIRYLSSWLLACRFDPGTSLHSLAWP